MLPEVNPAVLRESLRRNLAMYLEQVANGNVLALAEYIRCSRSILQNWLEGNAVPRLANLLRICRFLNVPVSSLFSPSGPTPTDIASAKDVARIGRRNVSPSRHASEIRRALVAAFHEEVPRSLSEVARTLGYTTTERLYQADRKLCHKIAARYRQSGRSHWWKKPGAARICEPDRIREILEQSLESAEPTSVHCIAAHLGYSNDAYIQLKFPELCRAIGEKIARAKQARLGKMRRMLKDALGENPAPTLADLSHRLGFSSSSVLRAHEPKLCDQLVQRRHAQHIQRRADLTSKAEAALRERPVPSARELCERLGITMWFMERWFPALKRSIAEQRRRCVSAETSRRREQLLQAVHDIATKLQNQGLYPSTNRIVEQLPERSCREWRTLTWAIREVHKNLRISM
jgi:transcriptional regulator with XRE-family HTH domain/DNA-binding MarR family transcriptional regulator